MEQDPGLKLSEFQTSCGPWWWFWFVSVTIATETSLDVMMATLLMRGNFWINLNGPVGDVERIFALAYMLTSFSEHIE